MPRKGLLVIGLLAILLGGGGYYLYSSRTQADVNLADKGTAISIWSNNVKVERQVPLTVEFHFSKSSSLSVFKPSSNEVVKKRVVSTNEKGDYRLSSASYKKLSQGEIKAVLESFLSDSLTRVLTDEEKAYIQQLAAAINNPNASSSSAVSSSSSTSSSPTAVAIAVTSECQSIIQLLQNSHLGSSQIESLKQKCPSTTDKLTGANGGRLVSDLIAEYQDQIVIPKGYRFSYAVVKIVSDRFASADTQTVYFGKHKYINEVKFNVALGSAESANISEAAAKFIAKLNTLDPDVAEKDGYQNLFDAFQQYMLSGSLYGYATADNDAAISALVQKYLDVRSAAYYGANLLANGGFEDGNSGWTLRHEGTGASETIISDGCRKDNCLKMMAGGGWQGAHKNVGTLEKGKTYSLSGYFKSDQLDARATISFWDNLNNKNYDISLNGSTTWKKISVEIVPEVTSNFEVYLYGDGQIAGQGKGTVYYDSISAVEVK